MKNYHCIHKMILLDFYSVAGTTGNCGGTVTQVVKETM